MRRFSIEAKLQKDLKKLFRKDLRQYKIIMKKISEIVNTPKVGHYKNLRHPLNLFKRVHIDNSFVLVFRYYPENDRIVFYDLNHHDKIYR